MIVQQAGPLPINVPFQAPGDEPLYLEINGSVWSPSANQLIGITINLDGQEVGHALIFSNGDTTHRTVTPAYIPVQLSQGQHTLELNPASTGTTSDGNDYYTAVIHY